MRRETSRTRRRSSTSTASSSRTATRRKGPSCFSSSRRQRMTTFSLYGLRPMLLLLLLFYYDKVMVVEASSFSHQHVVPPAQRHVIYDKQDHQRSIARRATTSFSSFSKSTMTSSSSSSLHTTTTDNTATTSTNDDSASSSSSSSSSNHRSNNTDSSSLHSKSSFSLHFPFLSQQQHNHNLHTTHETTTLTEKDSTTRRQEHPYDNHDNSHRIGSLWHVVGDAASSSSSTSHAPHDGNPYFFGSSSSRLRQAKKKANTPTTRRTAEKSEEDDLSAAEEEEEEEVAGFVQIDTDTVGVDTKVNQTSQDFNVTAEVEYNVSATVLGPGNQTNDTSTQVLTRSSSNETNQEEKKFFRPIRFRAILSELAGGGEHLTDTQRAILLEQIIQPALLAWSAALRVRPVVGNLTVDASQLQDGVTCGPGQESGLPSVLIPSLHFTEGIADTDMVVYISLAFQLPSDDEYDNETSSQPSPLNGTLPPVIDGLLNNLHSSRNATSTTTPSTATGDGGGHISNSGQKSRGNNNHDDDDSEDKDNELVPSAPPSMQPSLESENARALVLPKQNCSGDFLAASSFCSTDQYDRPMAALLHLCLHDAFFHNASLTENKVVVMHELGHVLGFNAISLAHFRRPDGTPITPRREDGSIAVTKKVECTGPEHERTFADLPLPSEEILQFRSVRGGVRVAEIVTPSVAQVVRNHFDCQELPGAELESGEFLPLSTNPGQVSCLGDHWERRLFKTNLMNPLVDDVEFTERISTITLAYFADTGWYQVDLSSAAQVAGWGRGAGCAFVENTCISHDGRVPESFAPFFCNKNTTGLHGCTQDLTRKATCAMQPYDAELPLEYRYFNDTYGGNVGGRDPFMDYCPVYEGFYNGLCSDSGNDADVRIVDMEKFGPRDSRCLAGRLNVTAAPIALCLRIACVVEDRSLMIQVDGIWQTCTKKDQVLISRSGDEVICPDPVRICPTFYCSRDCLGTKNFRCDYTLGECVCDNPSCQPSTGTQPRPNTISFFDPPEQKKGPLPDEPALQAIYVENARALQEQDGELLFGKGTKVLLSMVGALLMGMLVWLFARLRRDMRLLSRGSDAAAAATTGEHDDGNDGWGQSPDPNKDKMIATVVVDMRMNAPELQEGNDVLEARSSETDISMTDTDGAGTHVTNLSLDNYCTHANGSSQELQREGEEEEEDNSVTSTPEPPFVVRRRNKHHQQQLDPPKTPKCFLPPR